MLQSQITHTMPLEDINKGFELMKSGESIRGVVLCCVVLF
jgi:S-(hydroxymethyl)glutathione dehydrogenase/alcohol dehydrogenase